ncbi:10819_t:CDS:2 [Acaulospora colombiana]|uniref:10819_t:CDS:1 n=1 Tax=Acaulospora colombiana TaxID=27376 RepID=A0ACA9KTJ8_9GLOM|nr:10819_t:CDS:2 [Acaulospora colombiana]
MSSTLYHLISIISLCLLVTVPNTLALYDKGGPVFILNEKNWLDEVLTTEQVVVVEFFAPWLAPEYKKAAENLKGLVKIAAVDCDDQSNRNVCSSYEIKGFPTIKLFPSKMIKDKKTGKFYKKAKDYNGPRTAKGIADFALPEIPSFVQPISNEHPTTKTLTIEEFLEKENETMPKVILFTDKDRTTYLYKALSVDFHDRLLFGEVRKREKVIGEKYGVEDYPKLIVVTWGTNEMIDYKGRYQGENIYYASLSNFLSQYALPKNKPKYVVKEEAEEQFNPEIIEIKSQSHLESECLSKRTGICILTFLVVEPEFQESVTEHENNLSILKKVKEKVHKKHTDDKLGFRFMWFDALTKGSKKLIKDFKLSDVFPNLMVLNPNRRLYKPYLGPFDEEGIEKFLSDVARGKGYSYEFEFDVNMGDEDTKKKKEDKKDEVVESEDVEKRENLDDASKSDKVEKREDLDDVEKREDSDNVGKSDDAEKKDDVEKKEDLDDVSKNDDVGKKEDSDDEKCGIDGVCPQESKEDSEKVKSRGRDEL